jgi:inward rectifier potassium channel
MVRLGYERAGLLADAEARVTFMRLQRTAEGQVFRQSDELKLVRGRLALLVITWTLMHEIDATSPLWGFTPESLAAADARLIVTIRARNHEASAEVFDMSIYNPANIAFGMTYQNVVQGDATGRIHADLRKLDLVEPDQDAANVPS